MSHDWSQAVSTNPLDNCPKDGSTAFFETRLCKGGPPVPAAMWMDLLTGDIMATVDGIESDPAHPIGWPWKRATERRFDELTKAAAYARAHYPDSPEANPRRPISQSKRRLS